MAVFADETVVEATERALGAAEHLTVMDSGSVAVLRTLARQIDYLAENGGLNESGKFDNVSQAQYLKYATELGLTSLSRKERFVSAKRDEGKPANPLQLIQGKVAALNGGTG